MDNRSDDESPYSISDDDEDAHELEIKPPQAKIAKHSHSRHSSKHSSSSRQVYGGSRHHHKSEHTRHHREKHHRKDLNETNRLVYAKKYEERLPEHDEYRRKKAYESIRRSEKLKEERHKIHYDDNDAEEYKLPERYREQDLREKIERRRHHHHRSEKDNKIRVRHERHEIEIKEESKKHRVTDEKKRRHRDDRKRSRSEKYRDDRDIYETSSRSGRIDPYGNREIVIDVETSPPVLRDEYPEEKHDEHLEEGEVDEKESSSSSSDSTGNSSSNNSSSAGDSSSNSGSSSSSGESSSSDSSSENDDQEENTKKEKATDVETVEEITSVKPEEFKETKNEVSSVGVDESKIEPENTLPSYFPAIQGCRSVEEFQCLNRIAEGTYGVVYRAREKRTDKIVALKRLKMEKEKEGFPITSLREINTLLKAQHPNIVTVREIVVGSNMDKIYIVMDYVEHDLKSLMETMKEKKMEFMASEVKCLMLQLLRAVNHLHDNWILHRDLKTSNLLFSHNGVLKVGDFGLAREYGSPLKHYTPIVVTLWYRAPELLLGSKEYSTSIDMWSVGCIFAEILRMEPLFPGKSDMDQLKRIFKVLGIPSESSWPEYPELPVPKNTQIPMFVAAGIHSRFKSNMLTELGYSLLKGLLTYNPKKRITADLALQHEYFREHPLPIDPTMFRTWPAKSEFNKKETNNSPKPPSGGQNYKDLKEDDGFYIGVGENPNPFSLKSTFCLKF